MSKYQSSVVDSQMQNLLANARRYSNTQQQGRFSPEKDNNYGEESTDRFDTYRSVPIQVEEENYRSPPRDRRKGVHSRRNENHKGNESGLHCPHGRKPR